MRYDYFIEERCQREINKSVKKNSVLRKILDNKINEIIQSDVICVVFGVIDHVDDRVDNFA